MLKKLLAVVFLLAGAQLASAQFYPVIATAITKGTTLPAKCGIGQVFFKTNATAGSNIFGCTSANTWTLEGGGGGGGATIPATTHIINGDGAGNGADSGIVVANVPLLNAANTFTMPITINPSGSSGIVVLKGATSGGLSLTVPAIAGTTILTFPAGTTDFSSTGGTSQVVKQTSSGGAFTVARLASSDLSDAANIALLNAANNFSANAAASTPPWKLSGTWFSGGSATSTKPQALIECTGATSTGWNTSGTALGINNCSGFAGYMIDLQNNGNTFFNVSANGNLASNGSLTGTDLHMGSGGALVWNSRAIMIAPSSGVIQALNSGFGDVAIIETAGFQSSGTKFTTSGCSISSTTGGATSGKFTLGANNCTATLTLNGASGITAANGWNCDAHDLTAPTIFIGQTSASNTTTAAFTIPVTAGATDVISFSCIGY